MMGSNSKGHANDAKMQDFKKEMDSKALILLSSQPAISEFADEESVEVSSQRFSLRQTNNQQNKK